MKQDQAQKQEQMAKQAHKQAHLAAEPKHRQNMEEDYVVPTAKLIRQMQILSCVMLPQL